jgi:hypothetical protein
MIVLFCFILIYYKNKINKVNDSQTATKVAQGIKLPENEKFYYGKGKLDYFDHVNVSFILSIDINEIKNLTIELANIEIAISTPNGPLNRKLKLSTREYFGRWQVDNGISNMSLGNSGNLRVNGIGAEQASGELTYYLGIRESTPEGVNDFYLTMGSTKIALKSASEILTEF